MNIGLKIAALFVFISLLPIAQGAEFPAWNSWHYSNSNIVKEEGNALKINMENESLSMSTVLNLTRGEKFSVFLNYKLGYVTMAGYRVFLNGEQIEEKELKGEGLLFINFSAPEDSNYEITLYFFVIQGTMNLSLSKGKIVAVPNGWNEGLFLSGIGITTVFGVLGLLSVVMYGMKGIKEKAKEEEVENMEMVEQGPTPEEIIAITAAIDAYMHGKKFKIISVKPSPWKYYGRMSVMRRLK